MLPDLQYNVLGLRNSAGVQKYPKDIQPALSVLLSVSVNRTITALGQITLALHDGEMSSETLSRKLSFTIDDVNKLLQVLSAIDYVAEVKIPVLTKSDEAMIRRLLAIGDDVMLEWPAGALWRSEGRTR